MAKSLSSCPDCDGALGEITLLDSTGRQVGGESLSHIPLTYTTPNASTNWLTTDFEKSGLVRAMACSECGRIFLYAQPRNA